MSFLTLFSSALWIVPAQAGSGYRGFLVQACMSNLLRARYGLPFAPHSSRFDTNEFNSRASAVGKRLADGEDPVLLARQAENDMDQLVLLHELIKFYGRQSGSTGDPHSLNMLMRQMMAIRFKGGAGLDLPGLKGLSTPEAASLAENLAASFLSEGILGALKRLGIHPAKPNLWYRVQSWRASRQVWETAIIKNALQTYLIRMAGKSETVRWRNVSAKAIETVQEKGLNAGIEMLRKEMGWEPGARADQAIRYTRNVFNAGMLAYAGQLLYDLIRTLAIDGGPSVEAIEESAASDRRPPSSYRRSDYIQDQIEALLASYDGRWPEARSEEIQGALQDILRLTEELEQAIRKSGGLLPSIDELTRELSETQAKMRQQLGVRSSN